MADARDVIIRPVVSERSMLDVEERKYTFVVDRRANKFQIRQAIEELFGVEVEKVNTMRMLGKMRRMGLSLGRRPSWKKAIVKLAPGSEIDFFEGMM
ncbi:MAG: 50S ribosomal protein L23 [Bacillota bacterium]